MEDLKMKENVLSVTKTSDVNVKDTKECAEPLYTAHLYKAKIPNIGDVILCPVTSYTKPEDTVSSNGIGTYLMFDLNKRCVKILQINESHDVPFNETFNVEKIDKIDTSEIRKVFIEHISNTSILSNTDMYLYKRKMFNDLINNKGYIYSSGFTYRIDELFACRGILIEEAPRLDVYLFINSENHMSMIYVYVLENKRYKHEPMTYGDFEIVKENHISYMVDESYKLLLCVFFEMLKIYG